MANTTETATFNVKSNIGEVSKDAAGLAGEFKIMGVSLNTVKAGFTSVAKTAKASFATIKAGIISTGIGALVVAVASLFSYFKNTQKGAEMLERAMAGMGAVIGEISDLFAKVGETIVGAFSDPKQAITDLWEALKKNIVNRVTGLIDSFGALGKVIKSTLSLDWGGVTEGAKEYGQALVQVSTGMDVEQQKKFAAGLKNIAKEMNEDVNAAMRLKGVMQKIRREEMDFTKVQAQTRQDVAKARLLAMDESKTQEERLKAINSVMESELKMTADIIEMQKKKVAAKREELTLNKTMIEDEEELAALEVELINLTTQSTMTQKRLMLEVETLNNEIRAKQKQAEKERLDAIKLEADERKKAAALQLQELMAFEDKKLSMQNQIDLLEITNAQTKADRILEIQQETENNAITGLKISGDEKFELRKQLNKKYDILRKQNLANDKAADEANAMNTLSAVSGLSGALSGIAGDNKELAAASAIIDTYVGANKAFAQGGMIGFATAAAVVIAGLVNVQKIYSTPIPGGGGGGGSAGGAPQTPAPQMMSGAFELGAGIEPEPTRAYVLTDEMSSSQNQLANIRRRATI